MTVTDHNMNKTDFKFLTQDCEIQFSK